MTDKVTKAEHIVVVSRFEDLQIHIIKLGTPDLYAVVWDDAYQLETGKLVLMTKAKIQELIFKDFDGF